jgi:hypothetical protein
VAAFALTTTSSGLAFTPAGAASSAPAAHG